MEIDVGKHIQELLYEHDSVSIPGLGGFVTEYQPAQIDHVQAKVLPPAREVSFNTNLPVDDGLLTQHIAESYELSGMEAERAIRDFVAETLHALDQGQTITIEGVGRLFKNYNKELQLMTDHTNFDTAVYGLPSVAAPVIAAATPPPVMTQPPLPVVSQPEPLADSIADWFQRNLWGVVSVAMVLFIFTVWLLFFNQADDPTSGLTEMTELPENRVNVSPGDTEDDELVMEEPVDPGTSETYQPLEPELDTQEESSPPPQATPEEDVDTDAPTVEPNQAYALVRIGVFGQRKNVEKLVQRIFTEGFEPYTRAKDGLIEVGVQFPYDDQQEVRANLRTIRRKFEPKAKLVK